LCYNDADILEDALDALISNHHQVIAWDHGSTDGTADILKEHRSDLLEVQRIPRSFDFYKLYARMSRHLITHYVPQFDWISWPDQDEILEGPHRDRDYYQYVTEVFDSPYDWVQFNNFNYWFTSEDDPRLASPVRRIKRYSLFPNCAPRIRAWRATSTNVRKFNHNPPHGKQYPELFNLRHYPMRSQDQMLRRLETDRAGLQRGGSNVHYNNMLKHRDRLQIPPHQLHRDDGLELNHGAVFDWALIYLDQATVT
jgi:glycosyltransferase involved in cell wall biosynthesis